MYILPEWTGNFVMQDFQTGRFNEYSGLCIMVITVIINGMVCVEMYTDCVHNYEHIL